LPFRLPLWNVNVRVVPITLLLVCVKIDVASERGYYILTLQRKNNETREENQHPSQEEQQENAAHSTIGERTTSGKAFFASVSILFIIYFNIFEILEIIPMKKFLFRKLVR